MTGTPRNRRGRQTWRVEFYDRLTGKVTGYAQRSGPPWPNGQPSYATVGSKSPQGLWTATEARRIEAVHNKACGTAHRIRARIVEDQQAAGDLQVRSPTGEASAA